MITLSNGKTFALKGKNVGPDPAKYKSNRAPNVWLWRESGVCVWSGKGTWVSVRVHCEMGLYLNVKTEGCLILNRIGSLCLIVKRVTCLIVKRNGFALWRLNSKSPTNTAFLISKTSEYYLGRKFLKWGVKKILFIVWPDKTWPESEKPGPNLRKKRIERESRYTPIHYQFRFSYGHTDSVSFLLCIISNRTFRISYHTILTTIYTKN